MISILIVEDEAPIRELLRISLKEAGYECTCAGDGDEAADILIQKRFDLVLLDIMLPGANGYELLEFVRPMEIPVIFLTAKGEVADKVKGLRMGAEDYITKPFELAELLARVETVLRRYHKAEEILACGAVKVDLRSHRVTRNSEPVSLTAKEYELLVLFLRNKNIALYRDRIYEEVWQEEYTGNSRTVDLHVQRIRKKLELEEQITAVYKIGYRLEEKE